MIGKVDSFLAFAFIISFASANSARADNTMHMQVPRMALQMFTPTENHAWHTDGVQGA